MRELKRHHLPVVSSRGGRLQLRPLVRPRHGDRPPMRTGCDPMNAVISGPIKAHSVLLELQDLAMDVLPAPRSWQHKFMARKHFSWPCRVSHTWFLPTPASRLRYHSRVSMYAMLCAAERQLEAVAAGPRARGPQRTAAGRQAAARWPRRQVRRRSCWKQGPGAAGRRRLWRTQQRAWRRRWLRRRR